MKTKYTKPIINLISDRSASTKRNKECLVIRCLHPLFLMSIALFFCLGLVACSSSSSAPSGDLSSSANISKSSALQCIDEGNVACAKESFCGLAAASPNDATLALRCCASQALNISFSENTQSLGKMLGYAPAPFASLKNSTMRSALSEKKIVFGELIFLSESDSPSLESLALQWGRALLTSHASTRELNQKFIQLGSDLETLSQCLAKIPANFSEDELEGNFFASKEKIRVNSRDLSFLQFSTSTLSYLLQSTFEYEWGFENFPSWPLPDSFYEDVNGRLNSGDLKWGDLNPAAASRIVAKAALLENGLKAFDTFLQQSKPGLIDLWLRWRFTQEDLITYTSVLRSASASMQSGQWMGVHNENFVLNLSALKQIETLPNAAKVFEGFPLLQKDSHGDPDIQWDYLKQMFVDSIYFQH